MKRPNLFIVGAPKCGTSAWYEYLRQHPDILFCEPKEPHFFCTDFPNFRWAKSEAAYLSYFADVPNVGVVGDASVQYLYSAEAAANIAAFEPRAKILIFLRKPLDFLKSYHNQLLLNLDEDIVEFSAAWRAAPERGNSLQVPSTCRERKLLDYRAVGRFGEQVKRYINAFPPSQILLVDYEVWTRNPRTAYLDILQFLGVEDDGRADFPRVNAAATIVSPTIARLTRRPPRWSLALARLLRRATGFERLGIAKRLRRANHRRRVPNAVPADVQAEIESCFAEDQKLLAKLRTDLAAARAT